MSTIRNAFRRRQNRSACFVGFMTAGFPDRSSTVPVLLSMERGGCDILELGVPFTDPLADGPVIQSSSQVALKQGVDVEFCLTAVHEARKQGLRCPVILMGYYNPFLMYGLKALMEACVRVGISGFIVVDLPPEEGTEFLFLARSFGLSYVPLITPATELDRIRQQCSVADSFIYVVSSLGVTGHRKSVQAGLKSLVDRVRGFTQLPLAVGFGIGNQEQFDEVAAMADGVVIGSKFISVMQEAGSDASRAVEEFARQVSGGPDQSFVEDEWETTSTAPVSLVSNSHLIPSNFGGYGGQFAPETLMLALRQLEKAFVDAKSDPAFWKEFKSYYDFVGRPSKLQFAQRLTEYCGGAKIWLKREDLNHTGSHKINNALGQVLLAKRLGKTRIIAETGAGQHGVATCTVCAHFNLPAYVYMGKTDTVRQQLNVFRMGLLGGEVIPVESGQATLKDAINEAMRDWVENVDNTHYLVGSAIGPHPFPSIVREFQSVIGLETYEQMMEQAGKVPDVVIACVGGGSNAIGIFRPFENVRRQDGERIQLIGVEAGGDGLTTGRHSAPLSCGTPGVLHGCRTYLMQDHHGQIQETHSISAGLDYPGVGPEHAWLKDSGMASYVAVTDTQALEGFVKLSQLEGIVPALETAHAVYYAMQLAPTLSKNQDIVINVSGRGDKDVQQVRSLLPAALAK